MNSEIVGWFSTEDGTHIPLRKGQSKKQAIEERFGSKEEEIKYLQNKYKFFEKTEQSQIDKYKSMIKEASTEIVKDELNNFKTGIIITDKNNPNAEKARADMIATLEKELSKRK